MTKSELAIFLGLTFALTSATCIQACVHVPRTYKGSVTEKTKQALLFHDGVNAHLIIKTNLQASSGNLPDTMAWVIPLPSLPSHYEETNPAIFKEMFDAVEVANQSGEANNATQKIYSASTPHATRSIVVHPTQVVGSYKIQPIEILDAKNAGSELNHWLMANGFGAMPLEDQRPYLKRGAVFLALKMHGLRGGFSDIKPLHITYRSDTLTFPLKFSARSGNFDVELYTFTRGPLDASILGGDGLYADPSVEIKASSDAPLLWQTTGGTEGYLTRFEGSNFNAPQRSVRNFVSDPTLVLSKDNAPRDHTLPGDKPDYGIWGRIGMALVLVLVGFGAWRRAHLRPPSQTPV